MREAIKYERDNSELRRHMYDMTILKPEEGKYIGTYPELHDCIIQSNDFKSAIRDLEEAKQAWIAAALKNGTPLPAPKLLTAVDPKVRFVYYRGYIAGIEYTEHDERYWTVILNTDRSICFEEYDVIRVMEKFHRLIDELLA